MRKSNVGRRVLTLVSLLLLLSVGPATGQSITCPNTSIPNFGIANYAPPSTLSVVWDPPQGILCGSAPCSTSSLTYDVFEANAAGYCGPFNLVKTATTKSPSFTTTFCPPTTNCSPIVKALRVQVTQCPNIRTPGGTGYWVIDDLGMPAAPSLTGRVSAPGQVTLTMSLPNDKAYYAFFRAVGQGPYQQASGLFSCPNTKDVTDSNLTDGTYRYKLVAYTQGYGQTGVSSNEVSLTLSSGCPTPGTPSYTANSQLATQAGRSLVLSWTDAASLQPGGTYILEASRGQNFVNFDYRATTTLTSVIVPAPLGSADYNFFCRVRAVQPCGAVGPNNMLAQCLARAAPAAFDLTTSGVSLVSVGGAAPAPGVVRFRNVGAKTGRISVFTSASFFDVTPSFRDIDPGQEGEFTVTAKSSVLSSLGGFSGLLSASSTNDTFGIPVSLVVSAPYPDDGTRAGTKVVASASRLTFSAPVGQNPAPQQVTLSFPQVVRTGPVFVAATVGPGGSWLVLPNGILPGRFDGNVSTTITLSVDRSKRGSHDTTTPLRTLLKLRAVGATEDDSTVIEIVDTEPLNTSTGAGGRGAPAPIDGERATLSPLVNPPSGGTSLIIPVVVSAVGANQSAFYSDGWVRNEGALGLSVDLFFTPEGKDGLTDSSVVKGNINIPAGKTQRLSDVLASMLKSGGSGQLEIRSPLPGALTVRATAEAITGGDPTLRFGTEIPVAAYGSGLGLGQGTIVLPGISDDATNRANLILSETSGAAVTVSVTLYGADGTPLGAISPNPTIPAYGKIQFNRVVSVVVPGGSLTGGSAVISVVSGSGRAAAIATVIDNRTNSFSAVSGDVFPASGGGLARPMPELAGLPALVIPTVARVKGAANTSFQTSLAMANGTASTASLSMTYNYIDKNTGATASTTRTVAIPPRGSLPQSTGGDVLGSLFGLPGETFGWIRVDGDVGKVTASASINAQVDPNDPSKGVKSAQVKGVSSSSAALARAGDGLRVFAGAEKSTQKRTNLILEEVDGLACDVRVRISNASGDPVAEKTYSLAPNQYFQINDVFGASGLNVGDGPFQDMKVSAEVLTGSGRIVSFVTVNDNVSKNPEIFLLGPQGPPPSGGSIGF